MQVVSQPGSVNQRSFCSSLAEDVWHAQTGENAFEWWYFDALSDDGREAVVITFTDNYVFSPRYASARDVSIGPRRVPAVTFLYSVNGKAVIRAVNEYFPRQFKAEEGSVECSIGESSFHLDCASYGFGYLVTIDIALGRNRRLKGTFEWLSIEADLLAADSNGGEQMSWNMVAPRSDVTGRIELSNQKGKSERVFHFRGTGYHDHMKASESLHDTLECRQWGSAHFVDSTAVYCVEKDPNLGMPTAVLYIVRDGRVDQHIANSEEQRYRLDKFGMKYPTRLTFSTDDNIRLRVKPFRVIDSGFCNVRLLSEMTLMLRDGKPRKTIGISECLNTKNIKHHLLRWFTDLRIGKYGKGPVI